MYFNSYNRVSTPRRGCLRARQQTYVGRIRDGGGGRHDCDFEGGEVQLGEFAVRVDMVNFNRQSRVVVGGEREALDRRGSFAL